MNYQTTGLFIYSGKLFLAVLLCLVLSVGGISAPMFYLLLIGLVLPLIVSMRLHQLKEQNVACAPSDSSKWLVYVQGIPVQETRHSLTNPGFFSEKRGRRFFVLAFTAKSAAQLGALVLLGMQLLQYNHWSILLLALIAAMGMVYGLFSTFVCLRALFTGQWEVEHCVTANDTVWYRGSFPRKTARDDALSRLIALV